MNAYKLSALYKRLADQRENGEDCTDTIQKIIDIVSSK